MDYLFTETPHNMRTWVQGFCIFIEVGTHEVSVINSCEKIRQQTSKFCAILNCQWFDAFVN